ncbi:hypothetical protein HMPREF1146_0039 [Prevotella sp. MSX73]|nr:hypothetical protein HMPREF1146_0039 [Prevotella sp. MSX73]
MSFLYKKGIPPRRYAANLLSLQTEVGHTTAFHTGHLI